MHVGEGFTEAHRQRLIPFGANPRQHLRLDGGHRAVVFRVHRRRGGADAQRGADQLQVLDARGARVAPAQVRLELHLIGHRQLPVDERLEQFARRVAAQIPNHDRSPSRSARSAWRARVNRDFTVPTATSSVKAISS